MIAEGRKKGIKFFLARRLRHSRRQRRRAPSNRRTSSSTSGPKTSALFEEAVGEFIKLGGAVAFYNGVFGMFEDPRFEGGTRRFIPQLKRMTDNGVEVYVGGGEGGAALEKYGKEDWATHVFTAGGTVLNALGVEPVPYMVALRMAAEKSKSSK